MEPPNDDERLIRRYLLGELTLEEQRELEQHLFSDEHLLSQLDRIENELTDQYVSGELSGKSKAQFERHFMRAPERRENVAFAKALTSYISAKGDPYSSVSSALKQSGFPVMDGVVAKRRPLIYTSLIAAAAILGIVFVWLFLDRVRLRRELQQARTVQMELEKREEDLRVQFDEQRVEADRLARELEREKEKLSVHETGASPLHGTPTAESPLEGLTFLFSGSIRSQDESTTVKILPGEKNIRLALMIDRELYDRYKVGVTAVESRQGVWSKAGLRAIRTRHGLSVITAVPVANLTMSDYRVELEGVKGDQNWEKAGYYTFRIEKE